MIKIGSKGPLRFTSCKFLFLTWQRASHVSIGSCPIKLLWLCTSPACNFCLGNDAVVPLVWVPTRALQYNTLDSRDAKISLLVLRCHFTGVRNRCRKRSPLIQISWSQAKLKSRLRFVFLVGFAPKEFEFQSELDSTDLARRRRAYGSAQPTGRLPLARIWCPHCSLLSVIWCLTIQFSLGAAV